MIKSFKFELTRDFIESGKLEEYASEYEALGYFRRSSQAEREQSRNAMLSHYEPGEDVWLFAYGSLIWNPMIEFSEQRSGIVHGYHRRFCMWTMVGRGTPDCPGLVLGLVGGGSCTGVAFRIPAELAERELTLIWNREMLSDSYIAKIVSMKTDAGPVRAIAFAMNTDNDRYTGRLADEQLAAVISKAEGPLGPCRDYLINTVEKMSEFGLSDSHLSKLVKLI